MRRAEWSRYATAFSQSQAVEEHDIWQHAFSDIDYNASNKSFKAAGRVYLTRPAALVFFVTYSFISETVECPSVRLSRRLTAAAAAAASMFAEVWCRGVGFPMTDCSSTTQV